jgi:transposase
VFQWCKAYFEGSLVAVGANETVVPASELQETMKRIKQLEGALGRKTLENEILKEAVDFAKSKKWIARSPVMPGDELLGLSVMPLACRAAMCWQRNIGHLIERTADNLLLDWTTHKSNRRSLMWCTNELPTAIEGYGQDLSWMVM